MMFLSHLSDYWWSFHHSNRKKPPKCKVECIALVSLAPDGELSLQGHGNADDSVCVCICLVYLFKWPAHTGFWSLWGPLLPRSHTENRRNDKHVQMWLLTKAVFAAIRPNFAVDCFGCMVKHIIYIVIGSWHRQMPFVQLYSLQQAQVACTSSLGVIDLPGGDHFWPRAADLLEALIHH